MCAEDASGTAPPMEREGADHTMSVSAEVQMMPAGVMPAGSVASPHSRATSPAENARVAARTALVRPVESA